MSDPARRTMGPNRRNQMDSDMPATKTTAPIHGARCSSVATPSAARLTAGSVIAASNRPRRSRSSWLRDSERQSTIASIAGPGSGSIASAHSIVANAASMVTMASRNERKITSAVMA
jgi:hypothetical protein